tara:strand:+ start:126 stop:455 length:330 start_codon:yes stop_codon:yes gene_type:complete
MIGVRLYLAQRISAMVMAPLVIGHLVVMVLAVRGGLDAAEILARTQGSVGWAVFYGLFVVAVSIHAAIGLRVVIHEHLKPGQSTLNFITVLIGVGLLVLGLRAVAAVVL